MEIKILFLGFVFAFSVFALKNGVGLYYSFTSNRATRSKLSILVSSVVLYLAIFAGSAYALRPANLLERFDVLEKFLRSGMLIHVFVSSGLAGWGIWLLKKEGESGGETRGWLALVIPCPVCFMVVFMIVAFLFFFFPDSSLGIIAAAYLVFIGISLAGTLGLAFWNRYARARPNAVLGAAMIMSGAYYFLSATFMPLLEELETVYLIAACRQAEQQTDWLHWAMVVLVALVCFAAGFRQERKAIRR